MFIQSFYIPSFINCKLILISYIHTYYLGKFKCLASWNTSISSKLEQKGKYIYKRKTKSKCLCNPLFPVAKFSLAHICWMDWLKLLFPEHMPWKIFSTSHKEKEIWKKTKFSKKIKEKYNGMGLANPLIYWCLF